MSKHEVLAQIREVGLVPVIRAESPEVAGQAIEAIRAGGVPILEITMTVPGAIRLIEEMARRYGGDAVVGAGTVLDPETARACILAGARSDMVRVSPGGAVGGANYIKALKAPLPQVDLVPTGGVSLKTAADFIKAGATALGVGADLVDTKALQEGRAAEITRKARELVEIVKAARGECPP